MNLSRLAAGSVILMLAVPASAADKKQPTPANAWRNARWGMTIDEVLAAFPGEARRTAKEEVLGESVALGEIRPYQVGTRDFHVRFLFDGQRRLDGVRISGLPVSQCDQGTFDELSKILTEKYGPPLTSEKDGRDRNMSWKTPQALIDLNYAYMDEGQIVRGGPIVTLAVCILNYRPPTRVGSDKL